MTPEIQGGQESLDRKVAENRPRASPLTRATWVLGGFAFGTLLGMSGEGEYEHLKNLFLTGLVPLGLLPVIDHLTDSAKGRPSNWGGIYYMHAHTGSGFLAGLYAGQFIKKSFVG